ncbi:hypothetical protein SEVIR_2G384200v4 [Setaria viridis]|uniref:BTB domain-containing protein n=1 Tax=Setaria viridis TaxID=4556 RepID=A0A4U6VZS7_SETVI|nr:BTB/POZ and MATH domain-containing protein 1-like [Setaria viridis]TKW35590.1 hypothetical protein SEVIR_2G384200v2 [Setaria viridis]
MASASDRGKPSSSASSIVADKSVGYHDLKIDGCALTVGTPTERLIKSCPFTVGGHRWRIWFYPIGGLLGYVSLYLVLDDDIVAKSVTAQVQFSVMLEKRALFFVKWEKKKALSRSADLKTQGAGACREWSVFAKREALGTMASHGGGSVTIRCDVTVFDAFRAEAAVPKPKLAPVPPSELQKHLGDLLQSGRGADVVFELDGCERFPAHRCVLSARSPVISAELLGARAREGDAAAAAPAGVVRVESVEARVFRALLGFAYTDALPEVEKVEENSVYADLLAAADRFSSERLKVMYANKLCERVDAGTVKTTLALAERHRCDGLKEACLDFLADPVNLRAAIGTHGM